MLMRTGETGSGKYPRCPICGAECETLFRDKSGVLFACDECVEKQDAWESEEAFFYQHIGGYQNDSTESKTDLY